jgi:hypothetical protein
MPSFRRPSLPSVLTPSRSPSNHAFASSRGSSRERSLLIDFPSGWGNGLVMAWYKRRKATIIQRLELRKEHDPFQHEYVLITLLDGAMFRLDRRPDPGVPVDTLMRKGCRAFDTLDEVVEGDELEPWHCVVDMHLHEDNQIDILRILEICYEVHSDVETRRYTLQRYNCYFMAWTTLLVISRLCSEISTQMSTRDAGMNQPFQTEIDDLAADIKTDLVRHLLRFSLWGQGIPPTLARFSHIGSESMAELLREDTLHQDFESLLEDLVIRLAQSVLLPGLWQDIQLEAAQKEPYENGQLGQNAAQLEQRMVQKVLERASYYLVSAFRAKGLPVDQSEPMRGVARNIAETWFRIVLESSRRQMIRLVQSLWQAGPPCPVVHVYKTGPVRVLCPLQSSSRSLLTRASEVGAATERKLLSRSVARNRAKFHKGSCRSCGTVSAWA